MAQKSTKYKFVSLFSGCGGFDAGFLDAGFHCAGAFDIDKTVLEVHSQNLHTPVYQHDLTSSDLPVNGFQNIDVLLAGSPCQGFSTIGKRKLDDPRNSLLLIVGKIAQKYKPKVVVAENVPGVRLGKHRQYWDQLHNLLRSTGYKTADLLACGTDLGLAQRRSRLFFLAWKGKEFTPALPQVPTVNLRDVFQGLDGTKNHDAKYLTATSTHFKIAQKIKPDQKLSNVRGGVRNIHTWDIPEVFGQTTHREKEALGTILHLRRQHRIRDYGDADPVPTTLLLKQFGKSTIISLEKKGYLRRINSCHDLVGAFNGKYRRLSWEKPSYTVDTRFGDPKYFLHPSEQRGFTVRESARIQGFKDDFVFHGSETEQFRMIGNAVPPPMANSVATIVRENLL